MIPGENSEICPSFLAHGIYDKVKISPYSQETSQTCIPQEMLPLLMGLCKTRQNLFSLRISCTSTTSVTLCEGGGIVCPQGAHL